MGNTFSISSETCGYSCTGFSGEVAHRVWKKLHDAVEEIDCTSCRDHARLTMRGVHDLVNLGIGEKAFDKKNFNRFADEVKCVHDRCKADGRC